MSSEKQKEAAMGSSKHVTIDEETTGALRGKITMAEDVVATIAGLAAREIDGVHSLGRSRLIPFGDSPTRGVGVEVGLKQAAFDIDIVVEYGCDIRKVAAAMRQRIAEEVNKMAGREVVEVNLNVVDIKLPETETPKPVKEETAPRVR